MDCICEYMCTWQCCAECSAVWKMNEWIYWSDLTLTTEPKPPKKWRKNHLLYCLSSLYWWGLSSSRLVASVSVYCFTWTTATLLYLLLLCLCALPSLFLTHTLFSFLSLFFFFIFEVGWKCLGLNPNSASQAHFLFEFRNIYLIYPFRWVSECSIFPPTF